MAKKNKDDKGTGALVINEAIKRLRKLDANLVNVSNIRRTPLLLPGAGRMFGEGGLPDGKLILGYGPSDAGKTTLAMEILGDVVRSRPDRKNVIFDYEFALDRPYAKSIVGANVIVCESMGRLQEKWDRGQVFLIPVQDIETGSMIADTLLRTGEIGLMVHDSIAAMLTEADLETAGVSKRRTPELANQLSAWLKKHKLLVSRFGAVSWFINHAKKETIGFTGQPGMNPWYAPGGRAQHFYADIKLFIRGSKSKKRPTGTTMKVRVERNKTATTKGVVMEYEITGLTGIDRASAAITQAVSIGLMRQRGDMLKGTNGTAIKVERLLEALKDKTHKLYEVLRKHDMRGSHG